jgi:CheY-like chemotaxis protein
VLVHWNPAAIDEHVLVLEQAGHDVTAVSPRSQGDLRQLVDAPPDVFLVDLDRRPSEGRAIAIWLRQRKAVRHVPLVCAGGAEEKVARVRRLLPDASYTIWAQAGDAVRAAQAPADPVVPGTMDVYEGRPLSAKLGLRDGRSLLLIGAPREVANQLRGFRSKPVADIVLLFARSRADLDSRLPEAIDATAEEASIWIAWPKQASGVATDLTQAAVRETGMAAGLVDFKVAAIDETWSGLRFARRR